MSFNDAAVVIVRKNRTRVRRDIHILLLYNRTRRRTGDRNHYYVVGRKGFRGAGASRPDKKLIKPEGPPRGARGRLRAGRDAIARGSSPPRIVVKRSLAVRVVFLFSHDGTTMVRQSTSRGVSVARAIL